MSSDARSTSIALSALAIAALAVVLVSADARARRGARLAQSASIDAAVRALPAPDFALSGGARWLRAPSLEEPGAAFADGPALADPDPAGGAMAPPRAAWADEPSRRPSP